MFAFNFLIYHCDSDTHTDTDSDCYCYCDCSYHNGQQ